MDVAGSVDVGARVEKRADDRDVGARGRPVQRRRVVARLARIRVGASGEQLLHAVELAVLRGAVQRRPS